tara:strand:+ start:768 stop:1061 length:294 start_codon:yes stop_codon:yes gene_type:complete
MHLPKETTTMNIESLITNGWTTDRVACEEAAEALAKSDPDWTYSVVYIRNDKFGKMYAILILDEDKEIVRQVCPRRMSRSEATKRREEKNRSEETGS